MLIMYFVFNVYLKTIVNHSFCSLTLMYLQYIPALLTAPLVILHSTSLMNVSISNSWIRVETLVVIQVFNISTTKFNVVIPWLKNLNHAKKGNKNTV